MENTLNMDLEVRDRSQIQRMGRIWCITATLKVGGPHGKEAVRR